MLSWFSCFAVHLLGYVSEVEKLHATSTWSLHAHVAFIYQFAVTVKRQLSELMWGSGVWIIKSVYNH